MKTDFKEFFASAIIARMERRIGQNTQAKSLSERLRLSIAELFPKENPPVPWEQWKRIIILNQATGIPERFIPNRFTVGQGLMDTFQEMLPIKRPGVISNTDFPESAKVAKSGLEVSRSLVIDKSGMKLLVEKINGGKSEKHKAGASLIHTPKPNEVGVIHTHPIDAKPSSSDALSILRDGNIIELVVTPARVFALFRTDRTHIFRDKQVAKSFIDLMAAIKDRSHSDLGVWTLEYEDYRHFNILIYEAKRSKNVFVRK